MKLPIEASDDDGILTKNGTMIYGKEDDAVTIGVQPLKDETGNVSFEGVRTLLLLMNLQHLKNILLLMIYQRDIH